jgi:hypothetical protein
MAVSAVYAAIVRVNIGGGQSEDNHIISNISATTASFILKGGRYAITAMGTSFGTLTLQIRAADGSTYLTAATAITANGVALADLPGGEYRWALA